MSYLGMAITSYLFVCLMTIINGVMKIIYPDEPAKREIYQGFSLILPFGTLFVDMGIKTIFEPNRSESKCWIFVKICVIIYYYWTLVKSGETIGYKSEKFIYDQNYYLSLASLFLYPVFSVMC